MHPRNTSEKANMVKCLVKSGCLWVPKRRTRVPLFTRFVNFLLNLLNK